jgi:hypothetical protein
MIAPADRPWDRPVTDLPYIRDCRIDRTGRVEPDSVPKLWYDHPFRQ